MSEFSPSKTVSIMIVDNDDDYIDVYKLVLETNLNHAIDYRLIVCYNYEEALQALNLENPDIIICELSIPGGKGEDLCELVRKSADPRYTSIIIASSYDSPQDVVRSFNAGADDFCSKKNAWIELPARITSALRIKNMQERLLHANEELIEVNKKLQSLSEKDDLIGLANMRSFKKRIAQEFSRATRYQNTIAVVMLDLDFFKNINDSSNHLVGSHVLAEVGKIIDGVLRAHDIGARFGGDEYVALLTQTSKEGAEIVAKRLLEKISNTIFKYENVEAKITPSIGFATFDPENEFLENAFELLRKADIQLYQAKENGRSCVSGEGVLTEPLIDYADPKNRQVIIKGVRKKAKTDGPQPASSFKAYEAEYETAKLSDENDSPENLPDQTTDKSA